MSNLYNAAKYKNKIINLLLSNDNFIKLIAPIPSKCSELDIIDVLLGGEWIINGVKYTEQGHIFDYDFTDQTTDTERTFVFVETDIDSIYKNTFATFNLHIFIFTIKKLIRLTDRSNPTVEQVKNMGYFSGTYANRIDILCDIVDRILNGNEKIQGIGVVKPASRGYCMMYKPNYNYYGKHLIYNISNLNEIEEFCGD